MAKKGQKQKERRAANPRKQRRPSPEPSGKTSNSDKAGAGGHRGLVNLGNTCFLNSILQCLNVSMPFTEELMDLAREGFPSGSIGVSLCSVFKGIRGQESSKGSISPKPLLQQLRSRFPWYGDNEQQDAHELLRNLLGTLSDEATKDEMRKAKEEGKVPPRPPGAPTGICEKTIWNNFRSHFAIANLCWGCGRVSIRLDPFLDVSLELPSNGEHPGPLGVSASALRPIKATSAFTSELSTARKAGAQKIGVEKATKGESNCSSRPCQEEIEKEKAAAQFAARLFVLQLTTKASGSVDLNNLCNRKQGALRRMAKDLGVKDEELEKADDINDDDKEVFVRMIISSLWAQNCIVSTDSDTYEAAVGKSAVASPPEIVVPEASTSNAVADTDVSAVDTGIDIVVPKEIGDDSGTNAEVRAGDDKIAEPQEPFEVVISRETTGEDGGRWGFEWNEQLLRSGSAVVDGIVPDSPLDKWNLKRQTMGQAELMVLKGDRLVGVNGCDSQKEMLKALKKAQKVTLAFVHEIQASASHENTDCVVDDDIAVKSSKKGKKGKKTRQTGAGSSEEKEDITSKQKALEEREARRLDFCEKARIRSETLPKELQQIFGSGCLQADKHSFAECLKQFSAVEALEEDFMPCYECTTCCKEKGLRCFASRRVWFWPPSPRLLTVQLKRFMRRGNRYEKSSTVVETPAVLDLTPFMMTEAQLACLRPHLAQYSIGEPPTETSDIRYELYGVCVHLGATMRSGHYIAYVNAGSSLEDENWYNISDSHVSKCKRQDALQAEAYVAFYRREGLAPKVDGSKPGQEHEDEGKAGGETSEEEDNNVGD